MARRRAKPEEAAKPPDLTGFLLALPDDAKSPEVARLAHEFGIKGSVSVTSWDREEPNIGLDILEGDPHYSVTRWPRDPRVRQAIEDRIASRLADLFVRTMMSEGWDAPQDKSMARARDCDRFIDSLRRATAKVEDIYFKLPVEGGDAMFRERVYCYELYHQLRLALNRESGFPYKLNGEVDKRRHPVLRDLDLEKIPDFLVHDPGTPENLVVMEVKPLDAISPHALRADLDKLSAFVSRAGYERGILLAYGHERGAVHRVREIAGRWAVSPGKSLDRLHLFVHLKPKTPAIEESWARADAQQ